MRQNLRAAPLTLAAIFSVLFPHSSTFARTVNHNLKQQVDGDENRMLPQGEHYSIAGDLRFYWNITQADKDYYHSSYWLDSFLEVRPAPGLAINARIAAFNPSNSYGAASTSYLHPFVSATFENELHAGMRTFIRGGDLDRQTIGAGLTLEEEEMSGLLAALTKGPATVSYMHNGLGGYFAAADSVLLQANLYGGLLGVYNLSVSVEDDCAHAGCDLAREHQDIFGLFSTHRFVSGLSYGGELASRGSKRAGMGFLGFAYVYRNLAALDLKLQYRNYEDDFAAGYVGNIQHDYLSVEQIDKAFTNSTNIFVYDDNVVVTTARIKADFFSDHVFRVTSDSEFGNFDYADLPLKKVYFFKHGVGYCPNAAEQRDDCLYVIYSNRISSASQPLYWSDYENKTSLYAFSYWGMEAAIRF